jgi:hypothetical protein
LSGIALDHETGIRDALNNSIATLYLLSNLFGGDDESYCPLETPQARRGLWLQLRGIADLLKAIEQTLSGEGKE